MARTRAENVRAFPPIPITDHKQQFAQLAGSLLASGTLSFVAISLEFESQVLETALLLAGGNLAAAALRLGMPVRDLRYQLEWRFPSLKPLVKPKGQFRRVAGD